MVSRTGFRWVYREHVQMNLLTDRCAWTGVLGRAYMQCRCGGRVYRHIYRGSKTGLEQVGRNFLSLVDRCGGRRGWGRKGACLLAGVRVARQMNRQVECGEETSL